MLHHPAHCRNILRRSLAVPRSPPLAPAPWIFFAPMPRSVSRSVEARIAPPAVPMSVTSCPSSPSAPMATFMSSPASAPVVLKPNAPSPGASPSASATPPSNIHARTASTTAYLFRRPSLATAAWVSSRPFRAIENRSFRPGASTFRLSDLPTCFTSFLPPRQSQSGRSRHAPVFPSACGCSSGLRTRCAGLLASL